jgi:hypothetical protein
MNGGDWFERGLNEQLRYSANWWISGVLECLMSCPASLKTTSYFKFTGESD